MIRAGLLKLGGSMLGQLLAADRGYRGPRVPCGRGHEAALEGYRDKSFDTALGLVTVTRAWYHCAACGHGLAPRDAELGVAGDVHVTRPGRDERPGRGRRAVRRGRAAAGGTGRGPAHGQAGRAGRRGQRDRRRGGRPGPRRADHRAEGRPAAAVPAAGQAVCRHRRHRRPHDRQGNRRPGGKGEDGRARTREVKLAVFFTQDKLDKDGYPVRDRKSASVIATFEPAATFAGLVKAEGIRRGADHVRQFTILGDGAAWIWNIAAAKFPEATQVVDLYHAREHLHDLARKLEFMLLDRKDEWLAARLEDLDYGYIDGITAAARKYPLTGQERRDRHRPGLLREQRPAHALPLAPPVRPVRRLRRRRGQLQNGHRGTLKQAGMHWTLGGADAIIALRCSEASSTWEAVATPPALRHAPPDQRHEDDPRYPRNRCAPLPAAITPPASAVMQLRSGTVRRKLADMATAPGELPIDAAVVRNLIGAQFPKWRGLHVRRVTSPGAVNAIFRLGGRLAARFPLQGADPAGPAGNWSPRQRPPGNSPPRPGSGARALALGEPGPGYPLPWSVQTWLPGRAGDEDDPSGEVTFASDLADSSPRSGRWAPGAGHSPAAGAAAT